VMKGARGQAVSVKYGLECRICAYESVIHSAIHCMCNIR